jgi:uncharacterized protein
MLEKILGSKLRTKVLGWLFSHPDKRYFVRQLTKLLEEDSTNVSRELARLEKTGILISTREGKQKYYQANRQSPLFNEIHGLVLKTVGAADVLRLALAPVVERIMVSFIFGSIASGDENVSSDIDVMVIGEISFGEISSLLIESEKQLGREINSVVYPIAEFKKKVKEDHHFVNNVLKNKKIFLAGDENELGRLAE